MKSFIIIFATLFGFTLHSQEVRVKFWNYSQTGYLIYNHDNGGYDVESSGKLIKIHKLEDIEYQGESWLHFQIYSDTEKIVLSDFLRYGFMYKDLSQTKRNSYLYWDYINNNSDVNLTGYLDYVGENLNAEYPDLGICLKFTFKIGEDFIIKKSSIPFVDSEDKNLLKSHYENIRGLGVVRLNDIRYYEGFDLEFNERINAESCENQSAYNEINNNIRINSGNPDIKSYFIGMKKIYEEFTTTKSFADIRVLDVEYVRGLGYDVEVGVICGVNPNQDAQRYLVSMQRGVKKNLGYDTYERRDLHMIDVFYGRDYIDFLNLVER